MTVISGWELFQYYYTQQMKAQVERRAVYITNRIENFSWIVGVSPELTKIVDSMGAEQDMEMLAVFQHEPFKLITNSGVKLTLDKLQKILEEKYPRQNRMDVLRKGEEFHFLNTDGSHSDYAIIVPILLKDPNSDKSSSGMIYMEFDVAELIKKISQQTRNIMAWLVAGIIVMFTLTYCVLQYETSA